MYININGMLVSINDIQGLGKCKCVGEDVYIVVGQTNSHMMFTKRLAFTLDINAAIRKLEELAEGLTLINATDTMEEQKMKAVPPP